VPYAKAPLIIDSFDLGALKHFDPLESERTLDRVKTCELLHQKAGHDYPVVGWMVDFAHAAKIFEGSGTAVSGNLHLVAVMMHGSPACVEAEIRRCMNTGSSTSMVAAGCEAPEATPDETLYLMDRLLYL
jgi:hypothetical protein